MVPERVPVQRIIKIAHTAERMTERSAGQRALKVVSRVTVIFSSVLLAATTAVSAESGWPEDNYSGIDTRPVVYLTFDDGPSADTVTEELLKVLARHNATATFFVTGRRVKLHSGK